MADCSHQYHWHTHWPAAPAGAHHLQDPCCGRPWTRALERIAAHCELVLICIDVTMWHQVALCSMQAMRANIRASQHMWRYDYTSEYIVRRVNATRGDPELSAYRPNGTECAAAAAAGRGAGGTAAFSGADGAAIRSVLLEPLLMPCLNPVQPVQPSPALAQPWRCAARHLMLCRQGRAHQPGVALRTDPSHIYTRSVHSLPPVVSHGIYQQQPCAVQVAEPRRGRSARAAERRRGRGGGAVPAVLLAGGPQAGGAAAPAGGSPPRLGIRSGCSLNTDGADGLKSERRRGGECAVDSYPMPAPLFGGLRCIRGSLATAITGAAAHAQQTGTPKGYVAEALHLILVAARPIVDVGRGDIQ